MLLSSIARTLLEPSPTRPSLPTRSVFPTPVARLVLAALLLAPACLATAEAAPAKETPTTTAGAPTAPAHYQQTIRRQGIDIRLTIDSLEAEKTSFEEGDAVQVRFEIEDTTSGQGLSALYPAAWMDPMPEGASREPGECKEKIENFIGGTLLHQPELDMNVYYVLALNEDPTISVVDPLFGFGGSRLLTMVFLESPGEDWAMTEDQRRLFVSLPDSDKVAVVDLASWKVVYDIDVGPTPRRVLLQPDERYLWVAFTSPDPRAGVSGVTVIDTVHLRRREQIPTGRGEHDLAVTDDDRRIFVSNDADGTVSVIDVAGLRKIKDIATGGRPTALAESPIAGAVYVTDPRSGVITAIDTASLEIVGRIQAEPGIESLRFAPGGRLGFVTNPAKNTVTIFDAALNRILQTADVEAQPDQVVFTDDMAYVRHRGSEILLMIPLEQVGREGELVPVIDFPGGQNPPGKTAHPSPADGLVQAPGASAVLISNPLDKMIYFYKEGMAAPMGSFNNYGHAPRAVTVVDRSLQETSPGVYETAVKLRRAGDYDVAFFLDAPRTLHCFRFAVAENPALAARRRPTPVRVEPLVEERKVEVGRPMMLRFRLTDPETGEPANGLDDVNVLTFLAPGVWHHRQWAESVGEGIYEVPFTPAESGVYYVFLEIESLGLARNDASSLILQAVDPNAPPVFARRE